jgi:hypothetical protein
VAAYSQAVLRHFGERLGHDRSGHLQNVLYHLIHAILREKSFVGTADLLTFCSNADNLSPWLPSRRDRELFSLGLSEVLSTIDAGREARACLGAPTPCVTERPEPASSQLAI